MSNSQSNSAQALEITDQRISAVETALKDLDALSARQSELKVKIVKLNSQEQSLLNNAKSDEEIQALITCRALTDVTRALVANVTDRIAAQTAVVLDAGAVARQYTKEVAELLANHRLYRALALVQETFVGQPAGDDLHLARHSKDFISANNLVSGLNSYHDDVHELISLRQLRPAFSPVVDAVNAEPGFELTFPESWVTAARSSTLAK
jgi:hypothetical protein